jgi:hypothetical protein
MLLLRGCRAVRLGKGVDEMGDLAGGLVPQVVNDPFFIANHAAAVN